MPRDEEVHRLGGSSLATHSMLKPKGGYVPSCLLVWMQRANPTKTTKQVLHRGHLLDMHRDATDLNVNGNQEHHHVDDGVFGPPLKEQGEYPRPWSGTPSHSA
jgi:hypothetical protein